MMQVYDDTFLTHCHVSVTYASILFWLRQDHIKQTIAV